MKKRIHTALKHFRTNVRTAGRTAAEYIKAYPEIRKEEALTIVDIVSIMSVAAIAITTITFYVAENLLG